MALDGELDPELALVFLEEARGHLAMLEDEACAQPLRVAAAHSLKGSAGLVGMSDVQAAAREAERLLRAGETAAARDPIRKAAAILAALDRDVKDALAADMAAQGDGGGEGSGALGSNSGFDEDETRMLRALFVEEAQEHLEGITAGLILLEQNRGRRTVIDDLMRKTHTLKGSAATVGLGAVSEAAHHLEDVFALLRSGRIPAHDGLFDGLLAAVDTLRAIVEAAGESEHSRPLAERLRLELAAAAKGDKFIDAHALIEADSAVPVAVDADGEYGAGVAGDDSDVRRTPRDDGSYGSDPHGERSAPRRELSGAHEAASEEGDVLFDDRRLMPDRRKEGDLHLLRVDAARVDQLMDSVGELVFDRTRIERRITELRSITRDLGRTRAAVRQQLAPIRAAGAESPFLTMLAARCLELETELAEHVAALSRTAATLVDDTEALRRTTTLLQTGLTQVRMMSVRWLFQRLARPLRDIARKTGKRIELSTSGEDTELDKTVVETITDPLIQILRNAVAHGIEPAHVRMKRGKNPTGKITLSARHQGDSVFLDVADDGAGIDKVKIRQVLVASGRLTQAAADNADDDRIMAAIFEPGISARDSADELSGRGVGLDVVRENIARLGGEIAVTSVPGEGTRFSLRLPLTTAITQALLFKVAGQVYAIPNVHVIETTFVEASSPAMPQHLRIREDPVPLVVLHRLLGADMPADARRVPAVVLEFAGRRLAATCDKIVGPREIVVKSLGPLLAPLGLYAGATISGAGKVQLILDPAALAQAAYPQKELPAGTVGSPMTLSDTGSFTAIRAVAGAASAGAPSSAGASGAMEAFQLPQPTRRILLADDSRSVREAVSRMLAGAGYIVDLAADGWEAWEMLQEVRYDLLITDLEMPRVGGFELIEKVRRSTGALATLPALVISSRTAETHRKRADQVGATAFVPKPVTKHALVDRVAELLRR